MKSTTETLQRRREAHHKALEQLAREVGCQTPGLQLWRKLNRLERDLYRVCEHYSNATGGIGYDEWQASHEKGKRELSRIFGGTVPAGVFINGDPRGHMLKLDNDTRQIPEGMERDWGGNGILAATIESED